MLLQAADIAVCFSEALLNGVPDADLVADPIGHLIDYLNLGLVIDAAERARARAKSVYDWRVLAQTFVKALFP